MAETVTNSPSVMAGTATTAGLAAVIGAGVEGVKQYRYIKNPKLLNSLACDQFKEIKEVAKSNKTIAADLARVYQNYRNGLKAGKIQWKHIATSAGLTALWGVGIYLAYRGIKGLFSKNDK